MAELKTHSGGCHCGKTRFEMTAAELGPVTECNCSICEKKGLLLTFVPAEQFKLVSGAESDLTNYQFNKKVIDHRFCPTCGVEAFGTGVGPDGKRMYAINVRCVDGVDLAALQRHPYNGRSR